MNFHFKYIQIFMGMMAVLLLGSCSDSGGESSEIDRDAEDQATIEQYLEDNDIVAEIHESGIYYTIVDTVPTGASANGGILSIYYSAKILDGNEFDRNTRENSNDSVKLKQGVNAVFPVGLDHGLGLMREGETFRFYIPSSLAYDDYDGFTSLIPQYAIIEIEVELAAIQTDADIITEQLAAIDDYIDDQSLNDTDANPLDSVEYLSSQQIYYKRLAEGTEDDTLRNDELATFSYIGTNLDAEEFDRRPDATPFSYVFGSNAIVTGLEEGLSEMERGETALIILPSHKAYAESVFVIPEYRKQDFVDLEIIPLYAAKVAPYEILIFETSLLNNP